MCPRSVVVQPESVGRLRDRRTVDGVQELEHSGTCGRQSGDRRTLGWGRAINHVTKCSKLSTMTTELPVTSARSSCRCGETNTGDPVLDARTIPHAVRHAAIFGALDSLKPGTAMQLIAPHEPLPLLAQIDKRYDGGFHVTYLDQGPEQWRLRLERRP